MSRKKALTMVTTNSEAEQIRQMFERIVQRTTQLVQGIDREEDDLLRAAYAILRAAIAASVPVLKYVDKDIRTNDGRYVRGIELPTDLLLIRGGDLQWMNSNRTFTVERLRFQGDPDEQMRQIHYMLMILGNNFSDALAKVDERQQSIQQRHDQFQEVARIFRG